ncbi:MAG: putative Long-chain-fatty-acyl-CoA reductase [Promethearchaeota archaeon]|nr:MAG: putative Long-chain-fatty-acyl-CoA reductase [Candidatus Lokiarchaeota archaeon]
MVKLTKIERNIPAFIFEPKIGETTEKTVIKRQDNVLEIEFPIFEKNTVIEIAKNLSYKKRRAHNRDIEEVLEIIDQVGSLWADRNYDIRKEVMEILPLMTGESRELCEIELSGTTELWKKNNAELQLKREIGGKKYLEDWIEKGNSKLHAQPRGLVLHNMAGNAFNLGFLTLFYGLVSKNVNLVKLSHGEPYVIIKLCQSIMDVDKNIAKEIAALYWRGSSGEIYDELFNSGYIDAVIAWGGIYSIEEIRRRAYRFGIKVIDHGPKLSFSIISEELFQNPEKLNELIQKLAIDVACWNQKACLSPRIIYIVDDPHKSAINSNQRDTNLSRSNDLKVSDNDSPANTLLNTFHKASETNDILDFNMKTLMKRSIKLIRNNLSDISPVGFARLLADSLKRTDRILPRANLTHTDGLEMTRKREYFYMNYATKNRATIITPPNEKLDWTVVYLRDLPKKNEIDMCQNRFVIVTRVSNIRNLIHSIRQEQLKQYLQTISVYGSDEFIEEVAEEFSLLGAYRFPRVGEHNIHPIGMPWDGHYVINDLIKWVYIGFQDYSNGKEGGRISLFKDESFFQKSKRKRF